MAVRRIPLPWDGQPQEVGDVDWGNSLLQDAEFVMLGSQIFWNPLNRTLTRVGGQEGGVTSAGLGQRLTTTQYLSYPASVANGGTGPWTLAGLFMPVSGATDGAAIAGMAEAPGSSTFDRSIRFLAGTYEWGAYLFDGGAKSAVSGVVPVNGRTDCVIGTTDGSSTLVVAANGREGSVAVTSGGFAGYTSAEICLGQANNISLGTMLVPIFVRTRGYWSASQRASFLANPWQVFAPRSIWAPVSAGGGAATDLTIQEAAHAHGADNLGLTVTTGLTVADATHAHSADNLTLSTSGTVILTIADTAHAHVVDSLALTVGYVDLLIADALHGQTADNLTLSISGETNLVIQDAAHGHTADAPTLSLGYINLTVSDGLHGHTADSLTLSVVEYTALVIARAMHGHLADNVTLSDSLAQVLGSLAGSTRKTGPTRSNRQTATRTNKQTATR